MLKSALSLMVLVPTVVAAQASAGASAQTQTSASAQVGKNNAQVESQTSVEGEIAIARAHRVPERPIRRRAAEGRAKGASEAQMTASAKALRLELEAAYDAMVRAGRSRPSDEEVISGAMAMEHGYTAAQIEAAARKAPSDRSLVAEFDAMTSTTASAGKSVVTTSNGNVGAVVGKGNAAAGVAGAAGATVGSTKGTVSGTVTGVLKKP